MLLSPLLYYIFSLKNKTKLQLQNTFVVIFPFSMTHLNDLQNRSAVHLMHSHISSLGCLPMGQINVNIFMKLRLGKWFYAIYCFSLPKRIR